MKKSKQLKHLAGLLGLLLFVSACGRVDQAYQSYIEEKVSDQVSQETSQTVGEDLNLDSQPQSVDQVLEAIAHVSQMTLGQKVYQSQQVFSQNQTAYQVTVDNFILVHTRQEQNLEGGLMVAQVTISNHWNQSIFFPIEEVQIAYQDATLGIGTATNLYPFTGGNLVSDLATADHEIKAGQQVQGYLVFQLDSQQMDQMQDLDAFYLSMKPPTESKDAIIGLESSKLGAELPFHLPLNDATAQELLAKESLIQDRPVAEWWGNKTLLGQESLNQTQSDAGIQVTLLRAELAEFTAFEDYQESFQYFPNGQVLLTVEFEITNQSDYIILPVDSQIGAMINGDYIGAEYALINEVYGVKLAPGETITTVRTFALDKGTYMDRWEDQSIAFEVNLALVDLSPDQAQTSQVTTQADLANSDQETTIEETSLNDQSVPSLVLTFDWQPQVEPVTESTTSQTERQGDSLSEETSTISESSPQADGTVSWPTIETTSQQP